MDSNKEFTYIYSLEEKGTNNIRYKGIPNRVKKLKNYKIELI
jgi:hypothetical protein